MSGLKSLKFKHLSQSTSSKHIASSIRSSMALSNAKSLMFKSPRLMFDKIWSLVCQKTWKFNTFQHIQTVSTLISTGNFRIPPASGPSLDSPDELRRVAAVLLEVPEANRPPRKWQAKLATAALLWWANPRDLRCQNDENVSMMSNCLYQAARSQVKLICQNLLQASPTCKPIDCTPPCTHWTVFHLESFSHLFTSLLKPDKCGPWSQEQTKQLQRSCLGKLDKTRHGTTWCNLGRSIQFYRRMIYILRTPALLKRWLDILKSFPVFGFPKHNQEG